VTPLYERPIYQEDWLGLKALDKEGKLEFKTSPGQHMQLSEKVLKNTFEEYFAPLKEHSALSPGLIVQRAH
jgi:palmitoyl-protein thioesterase